MDRSVQQEQYHVSGTTGRPCVHIWQRWRVASTHGPLMCSLEAHAPSSQTLEDSCCPVSGVDCTIVTLSNSVSFCSRMLSCISCLAHANSNGASGMRTIDHGVLCCKLHVDVSRRACARCLTL
eukprot:365608-Chlamydomonas_euryale.AAC.9